MYIVHYLFCLLFYLISELPAWQSGQEFNYLGFVNEVQPSVWTLQAVNVKSQQSQARIFKLFRRPGLDSKESILPAYVA
jgi:hypothetical protein